jgi:nucleotide-binding universal stress UspA family protein
METKKLGCDLMVMGGYSHSRVRELILGGVTRDIIEMSDLPVIMGH